MKKKLSCVFLFVFFVGCMDATKVAPNVAGLGVTTNLAMLEDGREIYLTRCAKCHNAIRITRHTILQWKNDILPEMFRQTKLQAAQKEAVTAYIEAVLSSQVLQ